MLKIDKKDYNDIDIYYIGYVTVKDIANCNNINCVNPLYLMINEMIGHFKEKNRHKYLVLDDVDENKEILNKYREIWEGVKKEIETINSGEKTEYGKDFEMEMMWQRIMHYTCIVSITIDSVMRMEKKNYPQDYLEEYKYKVKKNTDFKIYYHQIGTRVRMMVRIWQWINTITKIWFW